MSLLTEKNAKRNQELLMRHEGMVLSPYHCTSGKLTIGVGRNLDDVGISEIEAMMLLNSDIEKVEQQLVLKLPWVVTLPEHQKMVLINMAFNLGIGGLLKFHNMLSYLEKGDIGQVIVEMRNSRWATQVGHRVDDLILLMEGKLNG